MTKKNLIPAGGAILALIGVLAMTFAFGPTPTTQAHDVSVIDRTIEVIMTEFAFTVDGEENGTVNLSVGETVSLKFINEGAILHDAHFGNDVDLDLRLYNNNITAPFDMLVLQPGDEGDLTFTFTAEEAGTFELGCLQPGHYEAGMVVPLVVQ